MRSPAPTPGRNKLLENIWQNITNYTRTLVGGQSKPVSQYPNYSSDTLYGRQYDFEVREPIVRNDGRTRELVKMMENSPEITLALDLRRDAIWSNPTGDDQGWDIASTLNDNVTPINPGVYKVLQRLREDVIGGLVLNSGPELLMAWGDWFLSIGVNSKTSQIERVLFPPTFEMFRVESATGKLLGFQQRRQATNEVTALDFHPIVCAHARYRWRPPHLYGRSLFHESIEDWQKLENIKFDLPSAARSTGVNANLHVMPCEYSDSDTAKYKEAHRARLRSGGNITDYYLMNGTEIRKLSTTNPDFSGLIAVLKEFQLMIARKSKIPLYLMGYTWGGANDIATQPMLNYARSLNADRMLITYSIIKHLCNLELALQGYSKEQWLYRIIWPKLYVNPFEMQLNPLESEEANKQGIEDLDSLPKPSPHHLDWLTKASDSDIRKGLEIIKESNGHLVEIA
ncbi:MAG: class I SAM-dependent methyltransferase [Oscillatoriales cyanobacterium]|nr:MAG: class I SAM-dependent methyltransferase [Oscillatoriales cyanobacterium]